MLLQGPKLAVPSNEKPYDDNGNSNPFSSKKYKSRSQVAEIGEDF